MIISASRRTDIPSFYSVWFMNRLREGCFLTRNPMNFGQISKIPVSPECVDGIVFWTKDPKNMMPHLTELEMLGYPYYFQFTLTPYGKDVECNLRDKSKIIRTFQALSLRVGKERMVWRYDPIIINDRLTLSYHIDNFERICRELCGYTGQCMISFVDIYPKLNKRVKTSLLREITALEMQEIAKSFSVIGRRYRIEIRTCSEHIDLADYGVESGSCIDRRIMEEICGHSVSARADRNQRGQCGCIQSVDIGAYNTCTHGCVYCYANHSPLSVDRNHRSHNPNSELLTGIVNEDERKGIRERN